MTSYTYDTWVCCSFAHHNQHSLVNPINQLSSLPWAWICLRCLEQTPSIFSQIRGERWWFTTMVSQIHKNSPKKTNPSHGNLKVYGSFWSLINKPSIRLAISSQKTWHRMEGCNLQKKGRWELPTKMADGIRSIDGFSCSNWRWMNFWGSKAVHFRGGLQ